MVTYLDLLQVACSLAAVNNGKSDIMTKPDWLSCNSLPSPGQLLIYKRSESDPAHCVLDGQFVLSVSSMLSQIEDELLG